MYTPNATIKPSPIILGIESSCDETAAAIICGRKLLSSEIISSATEQAKYGGVVPEIASRAHTEAVDEVVRRALESANVSANRLDAIAVTYGAGLLGALLVGHTAVLYTKNYLEFKVLGGTCDDAAGEAFDKVARVLGLEYPGGANVERLARSGSNTVKLPPALVKNSTRMQFSYSGLKTAVINAVHNAEQRGEAISYADVACSFQHAAIDPLVKKTVECALSLGATTVTAGGGVIANGYLREALSSACKRAGLRCVLPPKQFCTDNAAMIASEGLTQYLAGNFSPLDINACAQIPLV